MSTMTRHHRPTCSPYCSIVHCHHRTCGNPAMQGLDVCSIHTHRSPTVLVDGSGEVVEVGDTVVTAFGVYTVVGFVRCQTRGGHVTFVKVTDYDDEVLEFQPVALGLREA